MHVNSDLDCTGQMTLPYAGVLTHSRPITIQRSFQLSGPWKFLGKLHVLCAAERTCSVRV
jgi:hypothetical protein